MAKSNNAHHTGAMQTVEPIVKKQQADDIAEHIKDFTARGGKIEVLGNTPLRWENRRATKSTKGVNPAYHRGKRKPEATEA